MVRQGQRWDTANWACGSVSRRAGTDSRRACSCCGAGKTGGLLARPLLEEAQVAYTGPFMWCFGRGSHRLANRTTLDDLRAMNAQPWNGRLSRMERERTN